MRKIAKQARIYIIILTAVAITLLVWSIVNINPASFANPGLIKAAVIFLILAIALELTAIEIPPYGYTSAAFCVYFAFIVLFDYPIIITIAAVALALRQIFINKQPVFYRLADFSTSIINLTLAGIIFSVVNRGAPFLSQLNIIGIIICAISFYGLEYILSSTVVGLLDEETRRSFEVIRMKVLPFGLTLAPLGLLLAVSYNLNPWLFLSILIPLYALRQSLKYGIREIAIASQKELESTIGELRLNSNVLKESNREITLDLQKKVDELSILFEMGQSLGTSVNLESTLEIIVSMIRKLMLYQSCVIFLIERGILVAVKSVTPYRDILEYSSLLKLEETIVNLVVQNKKPILITDMQSMSEQRIFKDEKSLICVPLVVKNEIVGVIYVGATRPGTYNEDHLHLLSILGNSASNAIRTSQLYEQLADNLQKKQELNERLESKVRQSEALLDLGQDLGSSLNLEETFRIIIRGMESMFNYQSGAVFLVRETKTGPDFIPMKYITPYEKVFENYQLTFNDTDNIMGWVSHNKKSMLLMDTQEAKLQTILENERSVMVVPLIVESAVTGAIYLGHSKPDFFNEEALELLRNVAYLSAMTIKNAELYEKTFAKAITDGLTGLYTHRYFQERLDEEIKFASRYGKKLALVMLDLDHFKQYNDTLGHPEGDKILKEFASLLKAYTRDSDMICRIGGDEFTILLKEVDKENARQKAEAIRQAVQTRFHERAVQVTASIGVSCFPNDAISKKDLVKSVDTALYESKKSGRNFVSVASPLPPSSNPDMAMNQELEAPAPTETK
ncbi:MAG: sensor domain-containing diguanylate cyclase [Candidatus Eremiobacteraeota bacterium]|nr:sensor domain-containing diguanylate cyclase [Candidatus Eremiobacteraeota bacterium]